MSFKNKMPPVKRQGPGMPSITGTYGEGESSKLVVRVGDARKQKLDRIASAQGKTSSDLIRAFIDSLEN